MFRAVDETDAAGGPVEPVAGVPPAAVRRVRAARPPRSPDASPEGATRSLRRAAAWTFGLGLAVWPLTVLMRAAGFGVVEFTAVMALLWLTPAWLVAAALHRMTPGWSATRGVGWAAFGLMLSWTYGWATGAERSSPAAWAGVSVASAGVLGLAWVVGAGALARRWRSRRHAANARRATTAAVAFGVAGLATTAGELALAVLRATSRHGPEEFPAWAWGVSGVASVGFAAGLVCLWRMAVGTQGSAGAACGRRRGSTAGRF